MKIVIVDSNPSDGEQLKKMLEAKRGARDEVFITNAVHKAFDLLKTEQVDLVFLDIALCEGVSFKLFRKYKERNFNLIFTTDDLKSIPIFEENNLDALVKPVQKSELEALCSKVRARITAGIFGTSLQEKNGHSNTRLTIKVKDGIRFVDVNTIIRCESDQNYTEIYLSNGEKILSSKTLKEHSKILEPHGFYRVHQSHLVDLNRIQKIISKDGLFVELKTGDMVELSRRRKEELMKCLMVEAN